MKFPRRLEQIVMCWFDVNQLSSVIVQTGALCIPHPFDFAMTRNHAAILETWVAVSLVHSRKIFTIVHEQYV
jgi:hypothetical protein